MPRGRPKKISDDELYEVISQFTEPFGASEIASEISLGETHTRTRLDEFWEEDILERKIISGSNVYWLNGH